MEIRLIIFFVAKDEETIHSAKTRPEADCGSDHELLTAKFRLKLKKVGKTTRPLSESESEVAQSCPTLATPWTAAHQAPPSMGFSRQEYWSGLPLPSPI